ncbi:hypothetical protein V1477_009213 [Vespula maculifrons]|uniref:Uncharacterized protein n=1 Tax=Vespula maculifrons TaxID=7453 RepID=A0ABD2CC33_VESMC
MADGFRDYTLTWRKWNMDAPIAEPSRLCKFTKSESKEEKIYITMTIKRRVYKDIKQHIHLYNSESDTYVSYASNKISLTLGRFENQ